VDAHQLGCACDVALRHGVDEGAVLLDAAPAVGRFGGARLLEGAQQRVVQ
jgi:hypothetical protein